ncbi:MAG: tetratricopeptide repeat protein [Symploca sp. SIO2E6]|nr:tetratricopeptide repeat protein [Symploca sp. SIO2E6]
MPFEIGRGLFKYDFTDHHAILGVPVDADVKSVRKRYLKIARNLHPDSCRAASEVEKKQANELLSKLVNPAYEQLSKDNRDYAISLKLMGKRLAGEKSKISVASEAAKQLTRAGAGLENAYKNSVQSLGSKQYASVGEALEKIAEISELNLVYLMLKDGKIRPGTDNGGVKPSKEKDTKPEEDTVIQKGPDPKEMLAKRVAAYIRRAEGYIAKNNFAKAVLELRDALKLDQKNSNCHSLLGVAYLKQKQAAMAKVHFNKALQLNPKDERALKGKKFLEQMAAKSGGAQPTTSSGSSGKSSGNQDKSGGGLFGMFGGKKK